MSDGSNMTEVEAALVGCSLKTLPADCRQVIEATKGQYSAISLTQWFTADDGENICCRCRPAAIPNLRVA